MVTTRRENCHLVSLPPADCLVVVMEGSGASAQALEFTELLGWDGYMASFEEFGAVDLALVIYAAANDNYQYALINGEPPVVRVGDVWGIDIRDDGLYPDLARQFPDLEVWGGDHSFVSMEHRPQGGQRFLFSYALVDGCHACQTGHSAVIAFGFDRAGQFLGTELLRLE